jgi:hypothetical protein
MIESIKGVQRIAAKLMHFDGAYLRFVGDLQISRYRGGELVETYEDEAILNSCTSVTPAEKEEARQCVDCGVVRWRTARSQAAPPRKQLPGTDGFASPQAVSSS